jgi:predicted transcriptional regulator
MNNPTIEKSPEKTEVTVELDDKLYDLLTTQANLLSCTPPDLLEKAVREFVAKES